MQRIFWGLVKIAVVIVLIVWTSRSFFSETSTGEEGLSETSIDLPTAVATTETIVEESEKERPLLIRSDKPITEQQKQYTQYSLQSGSPSSFSGTLQVRGTEPLSSQLARSFGEPVGEWGNLSLHKKTFWVLSELALRNINVDAIASLDGAIIEVESGDISVDISSLSKSNSSFSMSNSSISVVSPSLSSGQMESPVQSKKSARRMSARSWEKVLATGTR